MSASRKKQERKASEEPIISSRAQEEMEKEAKRKRNTLIYTIIGVVVAILVAILLIWDSGVFQRNATVATIDGEKVTAPQVAYYYYGNEIIYYAQFYESYGLTNFPYTTSVSPKEQTITADAVSELGMDEAYVGKTFHDYFLDYALNSLRDEYALIAAAKEAGYTLSEEGKENVKAEVEAIDETLDTYLTNYGADLNRTSYLQMVYGDSMTEGKYRTCLENATLASEFYDEYFDTLTADYTEADLDSYYQEHKDTMDTFTYYWRDFDGTAESTTDEEGNTVEPTEEEEEAAMTAAKEAAEDALAEVEGDVDAVKNSDDYTKASGLLLNISSTYHDWLIDPERQPGDATIYDNTTGYTLIVFGERYLDTAPTVNVRHALIEAVNEDDPATEDVDESTEAPTDEAFAAAEQKAQELLDQWKTSGGGEEAFALLAEEFSADTGSNTNGGLYEKVAEGYMIDAFNDWIFDDARQSGDTGLVKNTQSTTQGWHIIYFIGEDEPIWLDTARGGKWSEDVKDSIEIVRKDNLDSFFN